MHHPSVEPASHHRVEHLEIRARKVVSDDVESTVLVVQCPEREGYVRLEECVTCSYCKGVHVDPETETPFLVCEVESVASPEPPPGPAAGGAAGSSATTSIAAIMSRDVLCVSADMKIETLTRLFLERGFSGAPVVDAEGQPIGIVSKTDVLRARHEVGADSVSDIMMPLTFALPQGESIARAAALMAFEGVHRVAALGPHGGIVGIVSSLDILRWLARQAGFVIGG